MDTYEATKIVLSRIQSLDPENASKIMGFILIQDHGEEEMIRLAFGPEIRLVSLINQARTYLGLSSNTSSAPSSPSPYNPMFRQSSPRIVIPTSGFHMNPSSPSSPWSVSGFSDHRSPSSHMNSPSPSPRPAPSLSYAAVVNGTTNSASLPFYTSSSTTTCSDLNEEYNTSVHAQDHLAFLDDSASKNMDFADPIMSPSGRSDYPYGPCMYFARGFCKNGNTCKFLHSGLADSSDAMGSPSKLDGFDELVRMKAIQQQRFEATAHLMAGAPFPYNNRCMNLLNDNQRSAAAALMVEEEFHKFGRCRRERNEFAAMGFVGSANSSSRQIYLTFPADSTFKEEDVSNYFSMYGPVQDVRIPYQQKRMFGFVTFLLPETVKQILAKGNPHFVCDSRVLVKPYKEKGKIQDKKQQQQQMERGEFPTCLSPSGLDSIEPYDSSIGTRGFYNNQEMMLRRKLEEHAELQQAIEYQGRRLMNFQLMELKNHHRHHRNHQLQPVLSAAISIPTPTQSQARIHQNLVFPSDCINQKVPEVSENNDGQDAVTSANIAPDQKVPQEVKEACNNNHPHDSCDGKEECSNLEESDLHESLEHILPDNLFASPTKLASDHQSIFSTASEEADGCVPINTSYSSNNIAILPTTSTLSMTSIKSCYFQMPRFSSGQEAIEM